MGALENIPDKPSLRLYLLKSSLASLRAESGYLIGEIRSTFLAFWGMQNLRPVPTTPMQIQHYKWRTFYSTQCDPLDPQKSGMLLGVPEIQA